MTTTEHTWTYKGNKIPYKITKHNDGSCIVCIEGVSFTVRALGNCCGATLIHSISCDWEKDFYNKSMKDTEELVHKFLTKAWKTDTWSTTTPLQQLTYHLQKSKLLFVDKIKGSENRTGPGDYPSWYWMAKHNKGWVLLEDSRVVNPVHGNTLVTGEWHNNTREVKDI